MTDDEGWPKKSLFVWPCSNLYIIILQMYFIYRGSVEIVSEDGKVVFAVMKEGQFFGEISLFFSCPRTASIRAATNSDLFVVKSTDLYHALSCYPHIQKQIRRIAGKRADLARKRSMIVASALAKGMSPSNAAKVAATQTQTEVEESEGMIYRPQPPKSQKTSQGIKKRRKGKHPIKNTMEHIILFFDLLKQKDVAGHALKDCFCLPFVMMDHLGSVSTGLAVCSPITVSSPSATRLV